MIFQEGEIPCFTKNFQLSFELSIRDFDTFGYVFSAEGRSGEKLNIALRILIWMVRTVHSSLIPTEKRIIIL